MTNLIERDKRHIWHPFTQHKTECAPIAIERAEGAVLITEDGREILDLISSWWTITHGHSHPAINDAMIAQAKKMSHVMFSGFTHEPAVRLAENLSAELKGEHNEEYAGGLSRVFFSDNGSTSVEVALKVAFQYWKNRGENGRTDFIAFEGAYHGDTFGAMAVGKGSGFFNLFQDLLCEVYTVPYAETWLGDENIDAREDDAIAHLRVLLETRGSRVAALIMEPLFQGAGGMRFCRPSFVARVVAEVRATGILVIFDEIACGFGRTGKLFAHQHTDILPDIICLSKGLTAGTLPLSVTVIDEQIFDEFLGEDFSRALAHGHSFTGNPLACAIANRSLELFSEEDTLEKIERISAQHLAFAAELLKHPKVTRPRICGSLLAFDLLPRHGEVAGAYKSEVSLKLRDFFIAEGFNIRPLGNCVYLMPPYCTSDKQLARGYDVIVRGLDII